MKKYFGFLLGLMLVGTTVFAVDPTGFRDIYVKTSAHFGGTGLANTKSVLEITSTTKGFLPPRMTTTQQNAISSPPEGLSIYDTVNHTFSVYNGSAWQKIFDSGNLTGTVSLTQGGTGQTTANAALNALLPSQSTNANKVLKTDGTNTSWTVQTTSTTTPPTVQVFNSGTGTYTTPVGCTWIRVRFVGGGGGGAGSGSVPGGAATDGGATTFGSSLLTGNGGTHGVHGSVSGVGGVGGTATIASPALTVFLATGQRGGSNFIVASTFGGGGQGGSSPFGGGGAMTANAAGGDAVANTGSGGGGGGGTSSSVQIGNGGGSGGYGEAIIGNPSSTYAYAVGAAGAAGGFGTNGTAGGSAAAGKIIVEEFY